MGQVVSHGIAIRDVLRTRTREAHEGLHQHSSFVALFNETLCLGDYRKLILRLHGFYAPLDMAINRAIAEQPVPLSDYGYAMRSAFLAQDLMDLNFSDREVSENLLCKQAFDVVSSTSLGGVLYVVEGATLGGKTIDRYAQKLLCDQDPAGRRYWAWCRSEGKQRWSMALKYLEHLHGEGTTTGDIATGAHDTFQALADWLAPLDHPQIVTDQVRA